ncbi:MAG: YcjX family protein [Beijerinckiaceae bacterium]|nr:YcjX family protein [Beijerinckiaceae bacterium]MCZ8301263.1 YcjX family protein [Beijerinckiaceae bacterium]
MAQDSSVPPGSLWEDIKAGTANLGHYLGTLGNPSLRLGVTGLSRAGKTVFITGLVHALVSGGRMPAFKAMAEGRIAAARVVQHPDDALPRFAYEEHLATLTGPDRHWPQSTRAISGLSLEIEYESRQRYLGGLMGGGASRLNLDLVDYPGEWLLDLPLLAKDYATFSAEIFAKAGEGQRREPFAVFVAAAQAIDPAAPAEEPEIRRLADLFGAALRACRDDGRGLSALAPGRFLMPGDLEGAPALTFAPLPGGAGSGAADSLGAVMARRYEAYKSRIVRPFFVDHFSRIDRQVVLVDVLSALNGGTEALADLETALVDVLAAFRIGTRSMLASLFAPRVTRVLFAATKADHLHNTNHDRLEALLRVLVRRAYHRAQAAGVPSESLALASIRATREVMARQGGQDLPCVAGVPMAGERLGDTRFDGETEAALFPGDLPEDVEVIFRGRAVPLSFLRFRPPGPEARRQAEGLPHIRLDRALEFLLGDQLS